MTNELLGHIWLHNFEDLPPAKIIEKLTKFCNYSEDDEKTFFWLLLKSNEHTFDSETLRAVWIFKQLYERELSLGALPAA
jgi:hypothetical protein